MDFTQFEDQINELIDDQMAAIDQFLADYVKPFEMVGSPEKLMGKKYANWNQQDMDILQTVYGPFMANRIIFQHELAAVHRLEQEAQS